jgi:hypothetical protein
MDTMKTFLKTLLAGSVLAAAGAASAATINIGVSYDPNAEANFLAELSGPIVQENFDGWVTQGSGPASMGGSQTQQEQGSWVDSSSSFTTNVGTFTLIENGHVNYDWLDAGDGNNLKIESAQTGESGREELSNYQGDFWLDSNDAKKVTWDFNSGGVVGKQFDAFGFFIADAADVSATLTLHFANGSSSDAYAIPYEQPNGQVGYLTVKSSESIVGGTLTFDNSAYNDGWGIDDITVGTLPEPGTLLLMGLGLIGLGAARRRAAK